MYNTIILVYGSGEIEEKGDCILGIDNDAREIMRWPIEREAEARAELAKYTCHYRTETTFIGKTVMIGQEWALNFCECDEEGDLAGVDGGEYVFAEEEASEI